MLDQVRIDPKVPTALFASDNPGDTLDRCRYVLAFVRDFFAAGDANECALSDDGVTGIYYLLQHVEQATKYAGTQLTETVRQGRESFEKMLQLEKDPNYVRMLMKNVRDIAAEEKRATRHRRRAHQEHGKILKRRH